MWNSLSASDEVRDTRRALNGCIEPFYDLRFSDLNVTLGPLLPLELGTVSNFVFEAFSSH